MDSVMMDLIKDAVVGVILLLIGWIFGSHTARKKERKEYECHIERKFDRNDLSFKKITDKIDIIVQAIMNTNGYGKLFAENYAKILNQKQQEQGFALTPEYDD